MIAVLMKGEDQKVKSGCCLLRKRIFMLVVLLL
jgi:hypothetical protein